MMSGKKLVVDFLDLILELQLALFQPCQLQLIVRGGERLDRRIEVAMLLHQLGELGAQRNFVRGGDFTGHVKLSWSGRPLRGLRPNALPWANHNRKNRGRVQLCDRLSLPRSSVPA